MLVLLGVALTVGACGSEDGGGGHAGMTPSASSSSHNMEEMTASASPTYPPVVPGPAATAAGNDADVAFAAQMIPHHGQAVVMADMVLARSSDAEVKALAERIKQAQTPEIVKLAGWLKGWGKPVPNPYAPMGDDMDGMDHGGMMSQEQMAQMEAAMGPAADETFLKMMVEHHQGAVEMAEVELRQGSNPEAKSLAQQIITAQQAEIVEMKAMLARVE